MSGGPVDRSKLPAVLFIGDVARLFRCHPVTIRRRLRVGEFPVPPLPSIDAKLRWSARAVCDWIDACGEPPARRLRRRAS